MNSPLAVEFFQHRRRISPMPSFGCDIDSAPGFPGFPVSHTSPCQIHPFPLSPVCIPLVEKHIEIGRIMRLILLIPEIDVAPRVKEKRIVYWPVSLRTTVRARALPNDFI